MKMRECDILVVGAGPSGSSAALAAANQNISVLVVERRQTIGHPVQCAEYIPAQLLGEVSGKRAYIVQPIRAMRTYFPDGSFRENKSHGFTINRDQFDQYLANQAQKAGAVILTGSCARDLINGKVTIESKSGSYETVSPKIIIGADGPRSVVAKWMGINRQDLILGMQMRVRLKMPMDITEIYFQPEFHGGYGWLFPKGDHANVGIGARSNSPNDGSIKKKLNRFADSLAHQGKISAIDSSYSAGWIPVSPAQRTVQDNMMLIGDAAGHTHPITGAGIAPAVIGGKLAGKWAAKAVKEKNIQLLNGYVTEADELIGRQLKRAMSKRQLMERKWSQLNTVIKTCWPGFKEYYACN